MRKTAHGEIITAMEMEEGEKSSETLQGSKKTLLLNVGAIQVMGYILERCSSFYRRTG